ncbi:MAG TPA: NAD(+) synthase [Treponema sp.]|nr:NAD(+) synthase [Treponema sp.]
MKYGILRAGCAIPQLSVADCSSNAAAIVPLVQQAAAEHIRFLVFPELCITGYTCADLFLQHTLQAAAYAALRSICEQTKSCELLFAVGLPVELSGARYNCAAYILRGHILAVVPKTFLPEYAEFYERRWFSPATGTLPESIRIPGIPDEIPFGTDILLTDKNDGRLCLATELCEDVWVPLSPSTLHALHGATVIANLSASNEVAGKADYRRMLVAAHSAKTVSAYIYASAGHDESSTDMVFGGHCIIAQNGSIAAESAPFAEDQRIIAADIDLERLWHERLRTTTFAACAQQAEAGNSYRSIEFEIADNVFAGGREPSPIGFHAAGGQAADDTGRLLGGVDPHPFVPHDPAKRSTRCREVIEMQAEGLAKRLRHIHAQGAVIGLSGGLDSTLALLVTARAFDKCAISRSRITAITMPCFGTTGRTLANARALAQETGATLKEIDIQKAVRQHFADIGQDESCHDVTYENCQARERTQVLMDWANKSGGIVIGTGDLSELALGWCTYNGDQMSMYGVNASIPKTLVRYLVDWFASEAELAGTGSPALAPVLRDILATPVSPELLPPEEGTISQKTEELVGPYELHDFFLYHVLRWGEGPEKIFFLAEQALLGRTAEGTDTVYTRPVIFRWLRSFYRRFFSQQFKRSCMPDGAKVGTVCLSPRGDWRMPSDASAAAWGEELDALAARLGLEEP